MDDYFSEIDIEKVDSQYKNLSTIFSKCNKFVRKCRFVMMCLKNTVV